MQNRSHAASEFGGFGWIKLHSAPVKHVEQGGGLEESIITQSVGALGTGLGFVIIRNTDITALRTMQTDRCGYRVQIII